MHHPACPQTSRSFAFLPFALFLLQVLEEQLSKLFQAASTAAAASTALSKKASSKGAAGEAAAARAAAEAERVTKGLLKAAVATRDALQGRRLARGWNHLAFVMPQGALRAAQDFQQRWPGELPWLGVGVVPMPFLALVFRDSGVSGVGAFAAGRPSPC
jgi:hypothetical protein